MRFRSTIGQWEIVIIESRIKIIKESEHLINPLNPLSVFCYFVGLALKGLTVNQMLIHEGGKFHRVADW